VSQLCVRMHPCVSPRDQPKISKQQLHADEIRKGLPLQRAMISLRCIKL
jgi:hypothetical protein